MGDSLNELVIQDLVDAEFLADMGEPDRIGQPPIGHPHPQRGQTGLGEEQPWPGLGDVDLHQPTCDQSRGWYRRLRLTGLRTATPSLELEAVVPQLFPELVGSTKMQQRHLPRAALMINILAGPW